MREKPLLLALAIALLSPLLFSVSVSANGKINTTANFSISQSSVQVISFQLLQPIICPGNPAVTCEVSLDLTASDPSNVSLSTYNIVWLSNEWAQTRTVTLTTANTTTFAPSQSENIQVAIDSATSAPYYSDAGFSIPFTLTNTNPVPAPAISDQTLNVPYNTPVSEDVVSNAGNNPDPNTLTIVSGPYHGTASIASGAITYTPSTGYEGNDSLTYQLCSSYDSTICSTANILYVVANGEVAGASVVKTPDTGYGQPLAVFSPSSAILMLVSASLIIGGLSLSRPKV